MAAEKGYVIAMWDDENTPPGSNWVGYGMIHEIEDYADERHFFTLNGSMERFICNGWATEILEMHPNAPADENEIVSRCTWWEGQLALRDKEQDDEQL